MGTHTPRRPAGQPRRQKDQIYNLQGGPFEDRILEEKKKQQRNGSWETSLPRTFRNERHGLADSATLGLRGRLSFPRSTRNVADQQLPETKHKNRVKRGREGLKQEVKKMLRNRLKKRRLGTQREIEIVWDSERRHRGENPGVGEGT